MVLVLALAATNSASADPRLANLDLRLEPWDVAPAPPPPYRLEPATPTPGEPEPAAAAVVDQALQSETPNRRKGTSGPLETLGGDEGVLKELLENKTIPLFRLRVESPF